MTVQQHHDRSEPVSANGDDGSSPLRIAQVMVGFRPDGGAEQLVRTLLNEMRRTSCETDVILLRPTRDEGAAELESLDADLVALPARRLIDPIRFWRLLRRLGSGHYDVVHTHLSSANILGVIAGRLVGVPTVVTLHSTDSAADAHWYHGRLERLVLRHLATTIVAVGEETARVQGERIGRDDIVVLPNAVAPTTPIDHERRERLRRGVMVAPDRHLVLAVGRLEAPKGYPDLVEAFALATRDSGLDAELVIVGRGSMQSVVEASIAEAGVADRVHLVGVRNDVRDLMQASDLFVMSSRWEGLPMVLLEAMHSRLPIIATDVGDIKRVLDGTPSRVVEPGRPDQLSASIVDTLIDLEHGHDLTTAGHETVTAEYSSPAWASRLVRLYRGVATRT